MQTVAFNQIPIPEKPFVTISVPPGKTWETYARFYKTPDVAGQAETKKIADRFNEEIQSSSKISGKLVKEIKILTEKKLQSFKIGEYRVSLRLFDETNSEPAAQKCYSFTVFDYHLKQFATITDHIRPGIFPGQGKFSIDLSDAECESIDRLAA